jgi:hypothetical protein
LTLEFGRGFTEKALRRMMQLAEVFPDREIVAALSLTIGLEPLRRDQAIADQYQWYRALRGIAAVFRESRSQPGLVPARRVVAVLPACW